MRRETAGDPGESGAETQRVEVGGGSFGGQRGVKWITVAFLFNYVAFTSFFLHRFSSPKEGIFLV